MDSFRGNSHRLTSDGTALRIEAAVNRYFRRSIRDQEVDNAKRDSREKNKEETMEKRKREPNEEPRGRRQIVAGLVCRQRRLTPTELSH